MDLNELIARMQFSLPWQSGIGQAVDATGGYDTATDNQNNQAASGLLGGFKQLGGNMLSMGLLGYLGDQQRRQKAMEEAMRNHQAPRLQAQEYQAVVPPWIAAQDQVRKKREEQMRRMLAGGRQ